MKFISVLLILLSTFVASAQLQLNQIMAGNDYIGHQPYNIEWSPNNKTVYYRWQHNSEFVSPYYSTSISDTKPKQLNNSETQCKTVNGFVSDNTNKHIYFIKNNTLYKWSEKKSTIILQKSTYFSIQKVLNDGSLILLENNNLFHFNPTNGTYIQLTNFVKGNESLKSPELTYLENQQEELFDIIKENNKRQIAGDEFNKALNKNIIPKIFLNGQSLGWIKITDDLKHIVYRLDEYPKNETTHIEKHITQNGYTKSVTARAKIGKQNPKHNLYVMNLENSEIHKIDISQLPNIYDKPKYLNDNSKYDKPREVMFTNAWISENGNCLTEIKAYDNKTRWIVTVNFENGNLKIVNKQQDDAWIGGPGISGWNMVSGNVGWLKDNQTIYYQSEKTGYSHLYTYNIKTKTETQLTSGKYEIHKAQLSNNGKVFYITANKIHPGNREFYHLDISTKELTPILTSYGNYEVTISPNEKYLAIRYSSKNKPWELYLADNKLNAKMTQITKSTTDKFKLYNWREPEIIKLKTEQGTDVYARIYRPESKVKNGAAIQFVHGAGYLQNAHNWWSGYYREYMFNNLLCDLGYTVIDIDYRASMGYGHDFRTSIYRHMGGVDLKDQLIGRTFLINNEGINPNKIGIYGGSYGGFITLMAMLTEPTKFKCGAAVRSVTDWAHYNHEYTSNILNTPSLDSLAFKQSSPIYFANGLQNKLLILHGMIDDNVQFQDVVRLNQRFIELGKTNFEMALYPIEPHGFKETSSWIDEYTRILNLFNEELLNK